jgi:hypothetical protein
MKFPKERITSDLHAVARLVTQPDAPAAAPVASRRRWSLFGARASQARP